MSVKKSKLDLLVRVRYQNPLPAPPCPPKILDIPTAVLRYARPELLDSVANEMPLPMIVDAECGMPLDLAKWEALWEEGADESALNPDPEAVALLDPKDQLLLLDPSSSSAFGTGEFSRVGSGVSTPIAHVPWLRKTEYISRDAASTAPRISQNDVRDLYDEVDVSHEAQLRAVETSFEAANVDDSLSSFRHPTKPSVHAVESYEILPDADTWANSYDLFKFSERPGDRNPELDDPRLDCAIMRPMEDEGEHYLAYYLMKEDQDASRFKQARLESGIDALVPEDEATDFHFVRDYEVVKIEQDVPNEFLLLFDDGDIEVDVPPSVSHHIPVPKADKPADRGEARELEKKRQRERQREPRGKGVYYKDIKRKMLLKKKRTEPMEHSPDKWALIRFAHVPPSPEEIEERSETLAEVYDPLYLLHEADAEGEDDIVVHNGPTTNAHTGITKNGVASGGVIALGAEPTGSNGAMDGIIEQGLSGDGAGVQAAEMDANGGGEPIKVE
ncbi:uncharacterized protein STEHIDRAFT_79513 [Stereum hirsutum FP-91666 SS1]|uniref:uncharacterized protein n=1 Tax=Stereum hirsutum (strain FP-91666) TaxID=721885 RepID=UPI000440A626|nr:uncharacterized protein STEHIDRAFT_79513 [Stereum hirsutum FP-91666 SS1]EIM86851.1 hypothetical protein STEHIDRAFT_79513 [Stereum hirsutum FP-91666 SS1]